MITMSTASEFETDFDAAKKIAIESASALSVLGSAFIALSYSCHPALRTRPMVILLNLSLMDCGLGLSNLVGILIDFNMYYNQTSSLSSLAAEGRWTSNNMKILCETQAFLNIFFTISSFLWTSILSVHIYCFVVNHSYQRTKQFGRHLLQFAYLFCYGVPLFVTLWAQFRHHLGIPFEDSIGWCALSNTIRKKYNVFTAFFAYDLWFFSTVITIVVVYLSSCSFVRLEYHNSLLLNAKYKEDLKRFQYMFFLIPMVFILLRVWVYLEGIFFICNFNYSVLIFSLLAGVGDSGQGFANAMLFLCFTKDLKNMYLKKCYYFCRYQISRCYREIPDLSANTEAPNNDQDSGVNAD